MAGAAEHLSCAISNKQRADALGASSDAWEVVLLFYSALHVVQAYLETKGARFAADNHVERAKAMAAAPELRMTRETYKSLQDLSVQVRYDPDFSPRTVDFENARAWYRKVQSIVEPKVTRKLSSP